MSGSDRAFLQRPMVRVAGVVFSATTLTEAVDDFVRIAATRSAGSLPVRLGNAYSLAVAADDPSYLAVMRGPGVNLPDGAPVGWMIRWKRRASGCGGSRVRGPSFFIGTLDRGRQAGLRHYFLGTSEQTMSALRDKIDERFPGTQVVGWWSPPYGPIGPDFYDEAASRIEQVQPDVVWVGLGTPKQDLAAPGLADRVQLPVVGIGAAFDFTAEAVREAPSFFQDHGMEWLYRFATEPRRLWRRYLFGNVRFLTATVSDDINARRRVLSR